MKLKFINLVFVCLFASIFFSCSSNVPKGSTEAETLYNEASKYVEGERYLLATEKLNLLKTQYPYSVFSKKAELLLAEIQFKQENYPEASASYIAFRDLHPNYPEMSYVVWMIAESYYRQLPDTHDRDLSPGLEAEKYYNELIRVFPSYEKAEEAQKRISKIEKLLLSQELYIADFYFRTDVFDGAFYRYKDIFEKHPENEKVLEIAPVRILKSLMALKKFSDCVQYSTKFLDQKVSEKVKSNIEDLKARCEKRV